MNKLATILIGVITMASASCRNEDVIPDISQWTTYSSQVLGFIIEYQLPGNMDESVSPKNVDSLSDNPGFGTVFIVGYDYQAGAFEVPKFGITMQVHKFINPLESCLFKTFTRGLEEYAVYTTKNSIKPSTATADQWERIGINEDFYAHISSGRAESYSLCLDSMHFLRITASYGWFEEQSDEWISSRKSIFHAFLERLRVKKSQSYR